MRGARLFGTFWLALAMAGVLNVAAGCGRSWPSVRPISDRSFARGGGGVTSVDVLPMNVAVSAWEGANQPYEQIQNTFDGAARQAIVRTLARRGYRLGAEIDWNGRYTAEGGERGLAMYPEQLQSVAESLSTYGIVQAQRRDVLVEPYLPVRLGEASGADATLYVGGYAFSGRDPTGVSAGQVLKIILIATVIIAVVAIVAIAAKNGGGGGGGGAIGGVARAAGNAATVIGHAASGLGRVALTGMSQAMKVAPHFVRHAEVPLHVLDVFGRTATHLELYYDHEEELSAPAAPYEGHSQMLLEMTLIDNRTGHALWHARQVFHANPAKPGDVAEAMSRMLGTLPPSAARALASR